MGTISVSLPSDGQTIDAADYNVPINTIVAAINGNIDSNNILAGGVVPNSLTSGTGTSWSWSSWTPTWTNVSGGTLVYAKYIQIGKTVHFRIRYDLAGAGVSGDIIFTTPATMHGDYTQNQIILGTGILLDVGVQGYPAFLIVQSSTTLAVRPVNAAGTNATFGAAASSTNPFTWASGDVIQASGTFEVA